MNLPLVAGALGSRRWAGVSLRARPGGGSPTKLVIEQKLATGFQDRDNPKMGVWLNKLSLHFWTNYSSDRKWWG